MAQHLKTHGSIVFNTREVLILADEGRVAVIIVLFEHPRVTLNTAHLLRGGPLPPLDVG
eukprot:CAMPEP_0182552612 /NCGR_PEP_ID=MMETSP1323-20130603/48902_1 /TAXON_ID=236787 /ORGANISM="Florenciella parvula, Strain RCC1693" /LENGTH=58 /DNA_ID=CAMNT_0024764319 /DNA_START=51 /DNA_END=223 /DNA_ORIENTATION=+